MKTKSFSKKEALQFGWNTTKANFGLFAGIVITLILLNVFSNIVRDKAKERTITKEKLSTVVDNPGQLFENLIENNYIDENGILTDTFEDVNSDNDLQLFSTYQNQKSEIYALLQKTKYELPPEKIIFYILLIPFWIISILTSIGLIKIAIKLFDNKKCSFVNFFNNFSLFFKYLLGSILYGLIVFIGMLLLIVPGIIWSLKFYFFSYLIVDKNLTPVTALKQSARITEGSKKDLLVFGVLLGLINLAGALCLIVGLFVTIPTSVVAMTFVYKKLLARYEQNDPKAIQQTSYVDAP